MAFIQNSRKVNDDDVSEEDQWWPTSREAFGSREQGMLGAVEWFYPRIVVLGLLLYIFEEFTDTYT